MQKYPLTPDDVIDAKDRAAGRVNLCFNYMDYIHTVNAAFFNGFLVAMCETQEDFDSIDTETRIAALMLATDKLETFLKNSKSAAEKEAKPDAH